ncbi:MAG TPA: CDP-alcohol phosphatidyltransferase family protein [Polyangiaceae bacterium]|jgi:phosphatidylglycerophosphate synthase
MKEQASSKTEAPLEGWSRAHASVMIASLVLSWRAHAAWPAALTAAISCLFFLAASRGAHTPSGRFGLANAITCLRLALVLLLSSPAKWLDSSLAVALIGLIMMLDLLDGWLARSRGDASAFGARFDMETDAVLVFITTLRLWLVEGYGAWVLCAGLWRYLYVLALWLLPSRGREAPRSLLARYAFVTLVAGLVVGLVNHGRLGFVCTALGTLVVSASFVRSLYFSYSMS